jgi:PP-loop superfamily ATP-utilizing enzyme
MSKIHSYNEFSNQELIKETYDILEGDVSMMELDEMLNEGIFSFIKGIFVNPGKKRALRKLGDDLFKVKVAIQKQEIEENNIDRLESELKAKDANYVPSDQIKVARDAEDSKLKALRAKEEIFIERMDAIGDENDTLKKYVNKIKLEVRMKANDATIKLADDEMKRLLTKLQKKDANQVKKLDKELAKAA